ncbi:MAG: hypothetical protein JXB08_06495 [Bacilli bacterium]|nr:hypothetical protein [Bacilli bacterium]MBN2876508.1 hypothetical protein [Bacilli bacterium]
MKRILERFKYRFDQFLSKGTVSLVLSLFLSMIVLVTAIGIVLFLIDPSGDLGVLVWTSFMQTLDPGNLSGESGSAIYMIMMTIATIVGIFITSLFISFILNGFQSRLENLSRGRSKVMENGHTLILGWDDNIYVVLEELIEANKSIRKSVIVILSDNDSIEMNRNIKDNIRNSFNTKIICRSGSIFKLDDLEMCSIADAKSVIILENDMNTIKSLLVVVNSEFYQRPTGHVSALMYDECNIEVAKNIGKDKLEVIYLKSAITRIITQTCLQAGLSYVYNELLEFAGDEIYFFKENSLTGKTFEEAILSTKNAVVIGLVRNNVTQVKPAMDTVIEEGDQLILIAEDEDIAIFEKEPHAFHEASIQKKKHRTSKRAEQISIIGFNRKTVDVIMEFNNYLDKHSKIKVLVNSYDYIQEIEQLDIDASNIEIETFVGETMSREVLDNFMEEACKYVIIFANENVPFEDQDSETLLTLLHLRDIEEKKQTNFDIITEIADVKNSEIVDLAKVDDFIISELIANKMLAQISENRHLIHIFNHLLSTEGSEIYLKPVEDYIDIHADVDFYTLSKAACQREEIAIGFKMRREAHLPIVNLNPDKSDLIHFEAGDMVIVISED